MPSRRRRRSRTRSRSRSRTPDRFAQSRKDLRCAWNSVRKLSADAPDGKEKGRLREIGAGLHKCVRNLTTKADEDGVDLVESVVEVQALLICLTPGFIERVFKKSIDHVMEKIKQHIKIEEEAEEQRKRVVSHPYRPYSRGFGVPPAGYGGYGAQW